MDKEIYVSVIIPIYNGAKYIAKAMECIVNQTLKEIEILCVDDGSTDETVEILRAFQKKDDRITIYQNERTNAGAARNYGIDRAKGKYLVFWDGDDLFETDALEKMYNRMENDLADICVCNADHYDTEQDRFYSKKQYIKKKMLPDMIPFSKETNAKYILNFTAQVAWNKMFLREFVQKKGIRFQEIPRINDHYFVSICILSAEKITVVNDTLVHYRAVQSHNLTGQSSQTPLCKYQVQCDIKRKMIEDGLWEKLELRQSFLNKALSTMIHGLNIQNDLSGYKELYNKLQSEGLKNLGLEDYGPEFYYNSLEYHNLQLISRLPYDEYLFTKGIEYRRNIENKNIQITDLKKTVAGKEKELQAIVNRKWYKVVTRLLDVYCAIFKRSKRKK